MKSVNSKNILDSFKKPLTLKFPLSDEPEDYRYPDIAVDPRVREKMTRPPLDWSKPVLRQQLNGAEKPLIEVIRSILEFSIQKFKYGETPLRHWELFLRFSGERLADKTRRDYRIVESSQSQWIGGADVNVSKNVARSWLFGELLPTLQQSESAHTAFLVGSPGCGKSTFLKYLLTVYSSDIKQHDVIPSRFEFMKFYREAETGDLRSSFLRYMSFIHLRDVFLHRFFLKAEGEWRERFDLKDREVAAKEFSKVIAKWGANCIIVGVDLPPKPEEALMGLFDACRAGPDEYFKTIRSLGHKTRLSLLRTLNEKNARIVTIFDGIDYVAIEDMLDDRHLGPILLEIVNSRSEICSYYEHDLITWQTASIVVMRPNTLGLLERRPEISRLPKNIYFMGAIEPRVALLNALQRSLDTAREFTNMPTAPRDASRLMQAVESTVASLPAGSGRRVSRSDIYSMFCGNLRHTLEFLRVLFEWITTEAVREGIISGSAPGTLSETIEKLTSLAAHSLLRKRNYRMVELVLVPRFGWFENACRILEHDDFLDGEDENTSPGVTTNEAYTGFVDNIFNYHTLRSGPSADSHALLEKIRILQILSRRPARQVDVKEELWRLFGYKSEALKTTIVILLKSQMIEAVIERSGRQTATYFSLTGKGRFCLDVLIYNMAYLEHVFHQTLFPSRMLRKRGSDQPRDKGVFQWTARSISNVYAFITYIQFVENNRAGGRPVPDEFRIAGRITENVQTAIEKMLATESRVRDREWGGDHRIALDDEAWARLDGQINIWRINGLVASP